MASPAFKVTSKGYSAFQTIAAKKKILGMPKVRATTVRRPT
jgi:hypothetical protein